MLRLDLADVSGLFGSALMVVGYAYSNAARTIDLVLFNALNLVGALFLLASLLVHFNLASTLLEVVWALIASAGLAKALVARRRA